MTSLLQTENPAHRPKSAQELVSHLKAIYDTQNGEQQVQAAKVEARQQVQTVKVEEDKKGKLFFFWVKRSTTFF